MTDENKLQLAASITGSILKLSRLFEGMDDAVLDRLASELKVMIASPGKVLIAEGQIDANMYVVVAGEIEVTKADKQGRNVRVALLGPGDWVGEMSILDVKPRSATVRVVAPSSLVVMSHDDVTRLLQGRNVEQYTILLRNIGRELSRRLRVADGLIAQSATELAKQYVKQKRSRNSERPKDK